MVDFSAINLKYECKKCEKSANNCVWTTDLNNTASRIQWPAVKPTNWRIWITKIASSGQGKPRQQKLNNLFLILVYYQGNYKIHKIWTFDRHACYYFGVPIWRRSLQDLILDAWSSIIQISGVNYCNLLKTIDWYSNVHVVWIVWLERPEVCVFMITGCSSCCLDHFYVY